MQVHTFRAGSVQEALQQVRFTLGPDAAVLQTREVRQGVLQWLTGIREIEVLASRDVNVPSRLPQEIGDALAKLTAAADDRDHDAADELSRLPRADEEDYRKSYRECLRAETVALRSLVEELSKPTDDAESTSTASRLTEISRMLTELGIEKSIADQLVNKVRDDLLAGPRPNHGTRDWG